MRQFDPWPVFFRREWKRNRPFPVGFAITGFIITKFSLSLIEEDVKNSPFAQKHNSEEEELLLEQGPIDMKVLCDVCKREEAAVYCCADEAALCVDCDIRRAAGLARCLEIDMAGQRKAKGAGMERSSKDRLL